VQYAVAARTWPKAATLRRWLRAAQQGDAAITVRFVGTTEGRTLNAIYRGKDYATNVLTFVYDEAKPLAGDIVLCAPVVRREAKAEGKRLSAHCAHLVVHGMLHLQGFDHDTARGARAMEARESAILSDLNLPDPWAVAEPASRRR
jgi:probable rRNA maturation factor